MHTADICDDYREQVEVAESIFTKFGKKHSFSGVIHTVKVFEDNVLVKKALETIPKESVLVVDGGGSKKVALMGDNLAQIAVDRNLSGVIIYGSIRDSALINEMDVSIFALGTTPLKSFKQGKGQENIAVQFAGINFEPGSYIYADADGILVAKNKLI
ncbi:ribonuclease E activity regulator RraA [Halalkalibacter krulwichiae]|uniref:ribonuclease E activity regulator RraA n=1 Tax=Halalkalibacter krulwichiae TaxID=199441 RepID=UPI0035304ED2